MAEGGADLPVGQHRQTSRGEVGDARRVILKLHSLAMDPRNRPFIARDDGCLRNIIRTFDFPSVEVVYKALETLSYLCSHSSENTQLLAQLPGLKKRVKQLADEEDQDEDIKSLALHLSALLLAPPPPTPNTSPALAPGTPSDAAPKPLSPEQKAAAKPAPVFTYLFRVEGLAGEEDTARLEHTLIRVRGVISVSLDRIELGNANVMRILSQRVINVRAVVRAKCTAEDVIAACQGAEFNASVFDSSPSEEPPQHQRAPASPAHAPPSTNNNHSDLSTPVSERSGPGNHELQESPRYLTPPDLYDGGDRVLVSMEDKTIGETKERESWSWIQKLGRVLLW